MGMLSAPEMRMLLDSHGVDHSACKRRVDLTNLFKKTFEAGSDIHGAVNLGTFQPPPRCNSVRQRSSSSERRARAEQWQAERHAQDEEYQQALLIDQQREAAQRAAK